MTAVVGDDYSIYYILGFVKSFYKILYIFYPKQHNILCPSGFDLHILHIMEIKLLVFLLLEYISSRYQQSLPKFLRPNLSYRNQ